MNKLMAHIRSSNVINALGIGAALLVYWLTKDAALAGVAAVAVLGSVPSSTMAMIAKLESIEDIVANIAVPVATPPGMVTHTVSVGDVSQTVTGAPAAVAAALAKPAVLMLCLAFGLAGLTACSTSTTAVSLATAQVDAQNAIALYGVSKGIAEVAELTNPTLAPMIDAGIALADPIVAKVQIALGDAATDATTLEALVAQIKTQANALTVTAAPAIKVVPSAP